MARVFLSHASADKPVVRRIESALRAAGHDPWLDERAILVGESIPEAVDRGLREADFVVLCLSNAAAGRDWVDAERDAAWMQQQRERRERILPVRLEAVAAPRLIASLAYVDLFPDEQAFAQGIASLTRSIAGHAARRGNAEAQAQSDQLRRAQARAQTREIVVGTLKLLTLVAIVVAIVAWRLARQRWEAEADAKTVVLKFERTSTHWGDDWLCLHPDDLLVFANGVKVATLKDGEEEKIRLPLASDDKYEIWTRLNRSSGQQLPSIDSKQVIMAAPGSIAHARWGLAKCRTHVFSDADIDVELHIAVVPNATPRS